MTHTRLLHHRRFTERAASIKLVGFEIRIVAEAAAAARRARDAPACLSALDKFLVRAAVGGRAHISSGTIDAVAETLQQQRIVRVVERLSGEIGSLTPALTEHAGRSVQREHLESRIIGDR